MLEAADDGTMNRQNDANNSPNDTASRPRRPEYLDSKHSKKKLMDGQHGESV